MDVAPTDAWHLVVMAFLVLFAVVVNALDPSYEAYYTTFSTLVTLQIVVMALVWTWQYNEKETWLGHLCKATVSVFDVDMQARAFPSLIFFPQTVLFCFCFSSCGDGTNGP